MFYSNLYFNDTVNGNGFRTSLFVSGCSKQPKCKNCWNPQAWNFKYGQEFTQETKDKILNSLDNKYIKGLSILGGEPMSNLEDGVLIDLVKSVKERYPNKTIYCWTGYTFEYLIKYPLSLEFIKYLDMLRDGEYIEELKNLEQYLNGSSNQRLIDVQNSLSQGKTIEYKVVI